MPKKKRTKTMLSPKQAKIYMELRKMGVSIKKADAWVRKHKRFIEKKKR